MIIRKISNKYLSQLEQVGNSKYTFALDKNLLHSGVEKPTNLCHFSINILLFIRLDKSEN
jgi:hypothetical protein